MPVLEIRKNDGYQFCLQEQSEPIPNFYFDDINSKMEKTRKVAPNIGDHIKAVLGNMTSVIGRITNATGLVKKIRAQEETVILRLPEDDQAIEVPWEITWWPDDYLFRNLPMFRLVDISRRPQLLLADNLNALFVVSNHSETKMDNYQKKQIKELGSICDFTDISSIIDELKKESYRIICFICHSNNSDVPKPPLVLKLQNQNGEEIPLKIIKFFRILKEEFNPERPIFVFFVCCGGTSMLRTLYNLRKESLIQAGIGAFCKVRPRPGVDLMIEFLNQLNSSDCLSTAHALAKAKKALYNKNYVSSQLEPFVMHGNVWRKKMNLSLEIPTQEIISSLDSKVIVKAEKEEYVPVKGVPVALEYNEQKEIPISITDDYGNALFNVKVDKTGQLTLNAYVVG